MGRMSCPLKDGAVLSSSDVDRLRLVLLVLVLVLVIPLVP